MKPQSQLIKHDPDRGQYGDCFRTCVAVILDMDAAEVPHPYSTGEYKPAEIDEFLAERGLAQFEFSYGPHEKLENLLFTLKTFGPNVPVILTGMSKIAGHCVVVQAGEIVCDPSGNGIVGPTKDHGWWLTILARRK